ncbi:hypothetical protein EJ08DRAFT_691487 [Tothia fuscella]|uniref:Uncharacterized protein n=1 Tax=Tothia fuscella TaxID=1048955 RepID=A0A9P4P637_9PEZI|nr:hypothetical protein EJ08DRAFT_691487 [Tothia fuscella]
MADFRAVEFGGGAKKLARISTDLARKEVQMNSATKSIHHSQSTSSTSIPTSKTLQTQTMEKATAQPTKCVPNVAFGKSCPRVPIRHDPILSTPLESSFITRTKYCPLFGLVPQDLQHKSTMIKVFSSSTTAIASLSVETTPTILVTSQETPKDELPDLPPVPMVAVWILLVLICLGFLFAMKIFFEVFPKYSPGRWVKMYVYRFTRRLRKNEDDPIQLEEYSDDRNRELNNLSSGASLFELPLPYHPPSEPATPIAPTWTAAASSGYAPPTNTPTQLTFDNHTTKSMPGTPYSSMFPPLSRSTTSLRHRNPITPLHLHPTPTPRDRHIDPESLTATPMPSPLTPSFARYMNNVIGSDPTDRPSTAEKRYSPESSRGGFLSRSVDNIAERVSRYTADGGGEEGLLLPISMGEREEADRLEL